MPRQTRQVLNLHQHGWMPDPNATALPLNAWTIAENVRFNADGTVETTPGYTNALANRNQPNLSATPVFPHLGGTVDNPEFYYVSTTGEFRQFSNTPDGDVSDVVITVPSGYEVTNTALHSFNSFELFERPVFNNGTDHPLTLNAARDALVVLPNFNDGEATPTNYTANYLTSFGPFLVACGFNGSSRRVAISDTILTPGDYPLWDFSNTESAATEIDISQYSDGEIVFGAQLNNSFYIFTTANILRLEYLGGTDFAVTVAVGDNGAVSAFAVAEIPNGFFVVGNNECYFFDGSSKNIIGRGKWQDTFFASIANDVFDARNLQTVYDGAGNVRVLYATEGEGKNQLVINTTLGDVASELTDHAEITRMVFSERGIPFVPFTFDTLREDITFDTFAETSYNEFGIISVGRFEQRVLSVGSNTIFAHDLGSTFNGRAITAVLRRDYINDKAIAYGRIQVQEVIPFVEGADGTTIDIRVGGSDTTSSSVEFDPAETFNVVDDEKADFRYPSRYPAIEFTMTDQVSFQGYEVTFSLLSRR